MASVLGGSFFFCRLFVCCAGLSSSGVGCVACCVGGSVGSEVGVTCGSSSLGDPCSGLSFGIFLNASVAGPVSIQNGIE